MAMLRTCLASLLLVCGGSLAAGDAKPPKPTKPAAPTPEELRNMPASEIQFITLNGGRLAWRYLEDKGQGQDIALWIPDGVEQIRGVLWSAHRRSEAYRPDLHAWARANRFAVAGSLTRWTGYEILLPDQLGKLAAALKHEEIASAPWILMGFSRNVGANLRLTQLIPKNILCLLSGGGPGTGVDLSKPEQLALFKDIPLCQVNGSDDPFVDKMNWPLTQYPKIRATSLPYSTATEWGGVHTWRTQALVLWPFAEAVIAARLDEPGKPLKPWTGEGWLLDPGSWDGKDLGQPTAAASYTGDRVKAIWFPDARTAASARSYMSKETGASVRAKAGDGKVFTLTLADVPADTSAARWFSGDRELGVGSGADFALTTPALASGTHSVYAVLTTAGKPAWTQPVCIANGDLIDLPQAASEGARLADDPRRIIELSDPLKAALAALAERRASPAPARWTTVFSDDFEGPLKPAWYSYYNPTGKAPANGHQEDVCTAEGGVLKLAGKVQASAMLPWDLPEDFAVQYRARATGEKPCDLSLPFSANPSGSAFPWREGMMFQFGAKMNAVTQFLVKEQPRGATTAPEALIKPNTWHTVRVERRGGTCIAAIDGKEVSRITLDEDERGSFYGRRVGLYTFGGSAEFDDVQVQLWRFDDPAAVKPALPADGDLDALALRLAELKRHQFAQQRDAADWILRTFALELAPALGRVAPKLSDEALQKDFAARAANLPPSAP